MFPPSNPTKYNEICVKGEKKAEKNNVLICGLARNLPHPKLTIKMIERIGALFKKFWIVLYENDSSDDTLKYLNEWSIQRNNVKIISEKLDWPANIQDHSLQRRKRMAYARNKYLEYITLFPASYTIVLDTDLYGYSYEGILHSVGLDLDAVGSNSLLYMEHEGNKHRLYYDTYAYRDIDTSMDHNNNYLVKNRGDDPIEVDSCFGGLALYKTETLRDVKYKAWDCDHVTLHEQIRKNGYKVWMNPSQITLYTQHYYQL